MKRFSILYDIAYDVFFLILFFMVCLTKLYFFSNFNFYLFPFAISLGSLMLIFSFGSFFNFKNKFRFHMFVNSLLSLLIFFDTIYIRHFSDIPSVESLYQFTQISSIYSSLPHLVFLEDVVFFIDLPVFVLVYVYLFKRKRINFYFPTFYRFFLIFCLLSGSFYSIYMNYQKLVKNNHTDVLTQRFSNVHMMRYVGLLGTHYYDLKFFISNKVFHHHLNNDEVAEIKSFLETTKLRNNQKDNLFGVARKKNLLIIQVESLQHFVIGQKINEKDVTPNLNLLMKDSLYFEHFYQQTEQGGTSDAEFSVNTSMLPLGSGSAYMLYPYNSYHTIQYALKPYGYDSLGFHGYIPSFWNRSKIYPRLGVDKFYFQNDIPDVYHEEKNNSLGWGIGKSDRNVFKFYTDVMEKHKNGLYSSFIITLNNHYPYSIPSNLRKINATFNDPLLNDYINSVHYTDFAIGELIKQMKKDGSWENTVVVIYGDHNSSLIEKGNDAYQIGLKSEKINDIYYMKRHIPLIIHLPKNQYSGIYSQPVSQMDIQPTILHLLGIEQKNYLFGQNAFVKKDKYVYFKNRSFVTENYFYHSSNDSNFQNGLCYNIHTSELVKTNLCQPFYERFSKYINYNDTAVRYDIFSNYIHDF